eukprot:6009629-Karenia_brevis.AAC.1
MGLFHMCKSLMLHNQLEKTSGMVRGCADDIGFVAHDLDALVSLEPIFNTIQLRTGLTLKQRRCVLTPCAISFDAGVRVQIYERLQSFVPSWSDFDVRDSGVYLGFTVGPNAFPHIWNGAMAAYSTQV